MTSNLSADRAVHGIRFSIRELLLAIAAFACVLTGFKTFGFFGAFSSIALLFGALLIALGRRSESAEITRIGVALAALSSCVLGALLVGWLLFGVGPIYSAQNFPAELKDMAALCDVDSSAARAVCLGSFMDSEYAWELPVSPDRFERVIEKQSLMSVPFESVPQSFWRAFPLWWWPSHHANCRYFATPNFPAPDRGPDGEYYFTRYDCESQRLYVWYKFNF